MVPMKKLILKSLKESFDSRDDDRSLIFSVWEAQGLELTTEQKKILDRLYNPGSIIRCRARIQNGEHRFRSNRIRKG